MLRAQYEKEGEYVGLQTKFNYAWVRHILHFEELNTSAGYHAIKTDMTSRA